MYACEDRELLDSEHTCSYIRSNSVVMDKVISTTPRLSLMLNTSIDDFEEPAPTYEDIYDKIQLMMQETSPIQVFQALQSPTMRESLSLPAALWKEMEPELRTKIIELRYRIRKKREQREQKDQQAKIMSGRAYLDKTRYHPNMHTRLPRTWWPIYVFS